MKKLNPPFKWMTRWAAAVAGCVIGLLNTTQTNIVEAYEGLGGPPHIGTFEGSTTFTTSSSNGINPGLYLEVMDAEGNYTEYMSEDGVITIQNTKEGAYVTQAKLLGKTKYRDQDTGELLDQWEDGRNLKLESVQMPVLKTTGKNLFGGELEIGSLSSTGIPVNDDNRKRSKDFFPFKGDIAYVITNAEQLYFYDENKNFISRSANRTDVSPSNTCFIKVRTTGSSEVQIEKGTVATSYEPYKSNILTVNEDVTLRGIGNVKDELNLLTGEVTKRIGEVTLDGGENWKEYSTNSVNTYCGVIRNDVITDYKGTVYLNNKLNKLDDSDIDIEGIRINSSKRIFVRLNRDKGITDLTTFKQYLSQNPITIQYEMVAESIKTVGLNSTYYFDPVLNRDVRVNGTIVPLVASVTIPTEPLSFIIDPNQDEGQELVAPEFSITNQTPGSIYLNLKAFEQTTNVLNDVLPTTYPDWHQLDKHQSKDIALALVPKPSDGWMSLTEGPRYVADPSNYELGVVKAKSTVDFTFSALHGRTFVEELNPQYRLSFEFGF